MSKAFDCVDHAILLGKLKSYNFDNNSIRLLGSYLADRCQRVRCGGVLSSERVLNIGVPQDSILGPILFLIYIIDLPTNIDTAAFTLFADDTTVSVGSSTWLAESMAAQIRVREWFSSNRLLLNEGKTKRMIFFNSKE